MPSERVRKWFGDIVRAIELIERWQAEANGIDCMLADEKSRSAVERQLLIMSEAAIRLHHMDHDLAAKLAPEVDWAGVRGMGNVLRHRYDDMDLDIIIDVLSGKLTALRMACEKALQALS